MRAEGEGGVLGGKDLRQGTEQASIELSGVGTLVFFYDRAEADRSSDSASSPNAQAYFFPARSPDRYALRGRITVINWNWPDDVRIHLDARADDPKSTRIEGTLRTRTVYFWDFAHGLGPL